MQERGKKFWVGAERLRVVVHRRPLSLALSRPSSLMSFAEASGEREDEGWYTSSTMTNAEIAGTFQTIAKILDLLGENPFKIRAYDRAALTIGSLPRELNETFTEGGVKALQEIPGIGFDLSAKIAEMVETGKLKYSAQLRKKIPEGLLAVMEVEGMGPKKTKMVWEKLNVKNIEDLDRRAKSGKLAKRHSPL